MDESLPSLPANKPAPLETRVRFTLRGMFIATAVVAVCLAAVAPWLRHRTADERKALAKIWGDMAAGIVVAVVGGCAIRLREERRAGPARYRLPLSVTRLAGAGSVSGALFMLSMVAVVSFVDLPPADAVPAFNCMAIQLGVMLAMAGLGIWWRTGCLELCDNGVLQSFKLVPYKAIRGFRWGTTSPNLLLVQVGWMLVTVSVHPLDRPAVEQFLRGRLHGAEAP